MLRHQITVVIDDDGLVVIYLQFWCLRLFNNLFLSLNSMFRPLLRPSRHTFALSFLLTYLSYQAMVLIYGPIYD